MATPTCATDCNQVLLPVDQGGCVPETPLSEFGRLFVAKPIAAAFINWKQATEWIARINNTTTVGNDFIRVFDGTGDMPAAAQRIKEISRRRKKNMGKDRTLNFTIDVVTDSVYEFARQLECGGKLRIWVESLGGKMLGGNSGIYADVQSDVVYARGTDEIELVQLIFTWTSKFLPERANSPIFEGDENDAPPTVFDTVLTFPTLTTDTDAGVTGTVGAADADLKFEFKAISPRVGTPNSMSLTIEGDEIMTIDFPADYLNKTFRLTDAGGNEYVGAFTNGTLDF